MNVSTNKFNSIITKDLLRNSEIINQIFDQSADLIQHSLNLKDGTSISIYYFEGLTDEKILRESVISRLLENKVAHQEIFNSTIISAPTEIIVQWNTLIQRLLEGQSVLFIDGYAGALTINTKGWAERSIQEPISETIIKGSHDGFIENASVNIGLLRRYVPSVELKIKKFNIGKRATTSVFLIYLGDIANNTIVQEAEKRIQSLDIDTAINIGELSHYISDYIDTPFPQSLISERPDVIANQILNGKVAIILDRSPSAMIIPMNLVGFFNLPDDHTFHWLIASFLRLLRCFSFFIATLLPAIYIAIVSFHFEVIPIDLYVSIAKSRSQVPFSPILEAFIMEITLEMLREAGIRLPQPIGQTIGIVGGIVIGQAAVQAGIVSNIMVIIVSVTAIASFIIPNYDLSGSIRIVRFPLMLLASLYGIVGIVGGITILIAHTVTLKSFGSSYTAPLSPFNLSDIKNTVFRLPTTIATKRDSTGYPQQMIKKSTTHIKDDSNDKC
ncbi:spore germination protein [Bacillus thuringiensis serovar andalousiensis]|uniref:Spore germination protein n=1 Tax=Bacillus thuringiensis TaxID=1428 RepID=A0A9X6KAZ1_BACTU|nr:MULTISPECIES: spore germination protein [Bacillus cereus group]MDA2615314.1 spore germination protein [Bacillus cereus]MEB8555468.1 spore germination protein [Bacillus cereus]MEB8725401.1 spore germination protein [Bacillus cereus]MEB8824349.1 spore germination protein [Bacillus cereus]MEB8976475.1 spore germination protein [Bacillus cereus]